MSKDIKKVPQLRFPGFEGEWESEKIRNLGNTYTGLSGKTKEDFGKGSARFVTYMNVFSNSFADLAMNEKIEIDEKQNTVKYGDVFFTVSSETPNEVGMSSVWLGNEENVYLNSFCFGFRLKKKVDLYYLGYLLRSPSVRSKLIFLAQGISRYNISKTKVLEISVLLPKLQEQKKVGVFFRQLDDLIKFQEDNLKHLKLQKQALLQKMFPQNSFNIPEIRFPEFSGKWEEKKFLDNVERIIDFRGRTPKKLGMTWSDSGYLALSALNVKNGFIDLNVDAHYGDKELYDKWMSGNDLHKNQVVLTTEAPMGNVAQIPDDKKYILSQRTIAFKVNSEEITENFLAVLLKTPTVFKDLTSLSSGGTAQGVSQRSLAGLKVKKPESLIEQDRISELFQQLDTLITLHERKLKHLELQKKALLQQLFV